MLASRRLLCITILANVAMNAFVPALAYTLASPIEVPAIDSAAESYESKIPAVASNSRMVVRGCLQLPLYQKSKVVVSDSRIETGREALTWKR